MEKAIFKANEINQLKRKITKLQSQGKKIVWTNGCFDIIHPDHIETFKKAKELGDILIVGINSDNNPYCKTKPGRPINDENFRSTILSSLRYVDYVYIFENKDPSDIIEILTPNYILKGGDYNILSALKNYLKESINDLSQLVKEYNGILDITGIYEYILQNNLYPNIKNIQGFMPEGLISVKRKGKIIIVPTKRDYSTTGIIKKILDIYCK